MCEPGFPDAEGWGPERAIGVLMVPWMPRAQVVPRPLPSPAALLPGGLIQAQGLKCPPGADDPTPCISIPNRPSDFRAFIQQLPQPLYLGVSQLSQSEHPRPKPLISPFPPSPSYLPCPQALHFSN